MRHFVRRLTSIRNLLALILIGATTAVSAAAFAAAGPGAASSPFVQPKRNPVISGWAQSVIDNRSSYGKAKVWVYFVDKGVYSQDGMAAAAARQGITLTAAAAKRRAKVGRNHIEFLDIPVYQPYVDGVLASGAHLRHVSRWLNAASVEVDVNKLDDLAALPYVRKIDPVIGHVYQPDEVGPTLKSGSMTAPTPADATALNYGSSFAQLTQLNVPAVHQLGYTGQGVIVCMMDTGYRTDHIAFAQAYSDGRVLAEHDFIFDDDNTYDEPEDQPGQMNHGTYTWSALGGQADGSLYGPAYGAMFVLAKTEDIRSETQVEEDNWVAGMEWAEALGASVISSSLVYKDWYTYANYNGDFCVTTNAADLATQLGIVVCNAMGNYGPSAGTLGAPADADSIVSCGAVDGSGNIAGFSSRGPTSDGRTKPEVCARGISTACASPSAPTLFTTASGTSLSTPLIGGCAAVLLSAHPLWTPMQVREALMMTASQSGSPDNNYGWGIVDLLAATNYGPDPGYIPGDLNYDGFIDVIDISMEIDIVFLGSTPPYPPVSTDVNYDAITNPADIVMLIDYVFRGGAAPAYPSK